MRAGAGPSTQVHLAAVVLRLTGSLAGALDEQATKSRKIPRGKVKVKIKVRVKVRVRIRVKAMARVANTQPCWIGGLVWERRGWRSGRFLASILRLNWRRWSKHMLVHQDASVKHSQLNRGRTSRIVTWWFAPTDCTGSSPLQQRASDRPE
jgi:hypothetical protein